MENSVEVPLKTETVLPYEPAVPFLGINPEKNMIQKDTCGPKFHSSII